MDIEEWEVLSDDGFLEILDDGAGSKIFSRKYSIDHENDYQMNNYFNVSPRSSPRFYLDDEQIIKLPIELDLVVPPPPSVIITDKTLSNQDGVSQVFFKKENEFVDMKLDSPRSTASSKGTVPPFEAVAGTFQYKDDETSSKDKLENLVNGNNNDNNSLKDLGMRKEDQEEEENGVGKFNFWRWSLNGAGAICSFGFAAATICIIIFTGHQNSKNQQNHKKLRFQIYSHDKRIKQVVQQATKLNEAISMARGMPLTRAHFTAGGYHDSL